MVGVEHGLGGVEVEVVGGAGAPGQVGEGLEPGADPAVLGVLRAHPLEAVDLALGVRACLVGELQRREPSAELPGEVLLVAALAQLLLDGLELLAEQELALTGLHAVVHLTGDRGGDLGLGQRIADPAEDERDPRFDVHRLEQLDLALDGQVGPPAGQVGQRRRSVDLVEHRGQAAASQLLEERTGDLTELLGELDGAGRWVRLGDRVGLDEQGGAGADHAGTHPGPAGGADDERRRAARQLAVGLDGGEHADPPVATLDPGHEQQLRLRVAVEGAERICCGSPLVGLERHGHHHLRQHHARGER